jgi:hypothetical protein
MTSMTVKYAAIAFVVAGTLGLSASSPTSGSVGAGAERGDVVAQFCLPPPDSSDAHRFYCRWPG